jgi:hypothetical protein
LPPRLLLATFLFALGSRLCHLRILWVEEGYPSAAAINLLAGRLPYRDFWFDKPPLSALLYALWGGHTGLPLRIAGALYVTLCCWLLYTLAAREWGEREAALSSGLLAFFLTFYFPAAVIALGPDLLTVAPLVAALLATRWLAGTMLGLAFLANAKAALYLPLIFSWPAVAAMAAISLPALFPLAAQMQYAGSTFVADPVREGIARTANWLGFHSAVAVPALFALRRRPILWIVLALVSISLGLRFFPRYYFALLVPLCFLAGRGLLRMGRWRFAALALLAIPLSRFGPGYIDAALDRPIPELDLFRDSQRAALVLNRLKRPGDSLLVWGYRPEIDTLTRLPGGTPFLESQPLTGVFADRHLRSSAPSFDASANRRRLTAYRPTFIADGLGRLNPDLAIERYGDLRDWLSNYEEIARTRATIVYRIRR